MSNIYQAFKSTAFPCNPRPFARELDTLVGQEGTAAIKSDKAKKLLFILMAQAYGQIATIDLIDEGSRLSDTPEDHATPKGWDKVTA